MGVYDRNYMDGTDEATYGRMGERRYSALVVLIALNIIVWALWQFGNSNPSLLRFMYENFTASPFGVLKHYYLHTLITSSFSHYEPFHILFNMLFLWYFGSEVEVRYGRRNVYWLYLLTALLTGVGFITVSVLMATGFSLDPTPALGASGCVMGFGVIAAILDPDRPIHMFGIIPMKLKWLIVLYLVMDLLAIANNDGVAHAGHLGGAVGGFLFWYFDLRMFPSPGRENVGILYALKKFFRRKPKLRVVERRPPMDDQLPERVPQPTAQARAGAPVNEPAPRRNSESARVDAETSRRVDELLDKIHRAGLHALTKEERDFLTASSEKYRKR